MKKYVILSVNDNPDYLYFVPIAVWAWRVIDWEPVLFYQGSPNKITDLIFDTMDVLHNDMTLEMKALYRLRILQISAIDGYRSDTITQVSRLYAACKYDGYLMTGDIDMLPLSDYWKPNGGISVWGHDLTGYTHYPICYIGMDSGKWRQVMSIENGDINYHIKRDLDSMPDAKSPDFNKYWYVDQELITRRLKKFNPTIINRGQYPNGFARGRVDRGAWTLDHREFIDCHMHHQIYHKGREWKFEQTMEMLRKVWPDEDFTWFVEYHNEFKKLTGHA
jgi:hypothetical protein